MDSSSVSPYFWHLISFLLLIGATLVLCLGHNGHVNNLSKSYMPSLCSAAHLIILSAQSTSQQSNFVSLMPTSSPQRGGVSPTFCRATTSRLLSAHFLFLEIWSLAYMFWCCTCMSQDPSVGHRHILHSHLYIRHTSPCSPYLNHLLGHCFQNSFDISISHTFSPF